MLQLRSLNRIAFRSDVKNTYPYLLGTLFSEELLQRRDVVSVSFWKLNIPYFSGSPSIFQVVAPPWTEDTTRGYKVYPKQAYLIATNRGYSL
jgi:hypothetical protein